MIETLLQQLLERLDQRYYGKYRGYVADVDDKQKLGRIQARVPRLLGETLTGWALPCAPYAGPDQGIFTVPDVGSGVWIEFEQGDLSRPIWSGMWWGKPEQGDIGQSDSTAQVAPEVSEVPKHDYDPVTAEPNVRIFKSSTGHHIVMDDREDGRLEIRDRDGNRIRMSKDGLDFMVSGQRTVNEGARSNQVDGDDSLDLSGAQDEFVGGTHTRDVDGDVNVTIRGALREIVNSAGFSRVIDNKGLNQKVGGPVNENVSGSYTQSIKGKLDVTASSGVGISAGTGNMQLAGKSFKVAALAPDPMNAIDLSGLIGNISFNTLFGVCQIGGPSAVFPIVLGPMKFAHMAMLAPILASIFPVTAMVHVPAYATWLAATPVMDWSLYAMAKKLPFG